MDKLIEYVCDELKELEKKADKDGKRKQTKMANCQWLKFSMLIHLRT